MLCPVCKTNPASTSPGLGVLPCESCQERRASQDKPVKHLYEFVTDSIRSERKEYLGSIIPPWRDGVLSQEFVDRYGTDRIDVTPDEVDKAKNVWSDLPNVENLEHTK